MYTKKVSGSSLENGRYPIPQTAQRLKKAANYFFTF
jgi:hypothetical protein